MEDQKAIEEESTPRGPAGTLGDVLYGNRSGPVVSEAQWAELVCSIAARDQAALHRLYERARRPVFTLAVRITGSRDTAEEVTLDVFHDVWRRAGAYEAANGTVLGWIMNQARSRAIDRVRYEQRKKRVEPEGGDVLEADEAWDPRDLLELKQQGTALREALETLNLDERHAIESAFFAGLTHAEVAAQLQQPLGTVKTRIRSGLQKLRRAMAERGTP